MSTWDEIKAFLTFIFIGMFIVMPLVIGMAVGSVYFWIHVLKFLGAM